MIANNFRCREVLTVIGVALTLSSCAARVDYSDSDDYGSRSRSSSSGRSTGINVGLGILGAGVSAIVGGRAENKDQKPEEKKEPTAEEAEKKPTQ